MVKEYIVRDTTGQERTLDAEKIDELIRARLLPILSEIGTSPAQIAAGDLNRLISTILNWIKEHRSKLEIARIEFGKQEARRKADHDMILDFIRKSQGPDLSNVVSLEGRKRGIAA